MMAALGMLSGFCGTLLTPMAANFNMVPAAVLELKDRYARDPGAGAHRFAILSMRQHRADGAAGISAR